MLISGLVTIVMVSIFAGGLMEKVDETAVKVKDLDQTKVERNEANNMLNSLNRIETKLDSYILKNTKN